MAPREDAEPASVGDAGFLALPPLSPGLTPSGSTVRMDGASWISTWRSPGFMTGMSHLVSPDAPSGVVADLVKPGLPVQRLVEGDLTLRPLPRRVSADGLDESASKPLATGLRGFVQRLFRRPAPAPAPAESSPLDSRESTVPTVVPTLPQAPLPPVLRLPAVAAPTPSPELVRAPQPDLPSRRVAASHPSDVPGREVRLPQLPVIQRHANGAHSHAEGLTELPVAREAMTTAPALLQRQVDASTPSSPPTAPAPTESVASADLTVVSTPDTVAPITSPEAAAILPVVTPPESPPEASATAPPLLQRQIDKSTPSAAPTAPTSPIGAADLPVVATPDTISTSPEAAAPLPEASPTAPPLLQRQVDTPPSAPTAQTAPIGAAGLSAVATPDAIGTSPEAPLLPVVTTTDAISSSPEAPLPVVTTSESPDVEATRPEASTTALPLLQRQVDTSTPSSAPTAQTAPIGAADLPVVTPPESPDTEAMQPEASTTAHPLLQRQLDSSLSAEPAPAKRRRGLGAPLAERSLPATVQRTPPPAVGPVVTHLPMPTPIVEVQPPPVRTLELPDLPVQRTTDEPEAPTQLAPSPMPVLQPILADRPTVVPDRANSTPAGAPALQVRAIDRPPGRLQQLPASVQRLAGVTAAAARNRQGRLAMPTAPVPAINPLSSAPTPQHRATSTQLIAPATPVVVQRTATVPTAPPTDTHDTPDGTFVQLAEEPPPAPAPTPPASPSPSTSTTNPTDLDGLARRLYDPIARRLRAELRVDRERSGTLVDRPW